jgi:hypothetical protein
MYLLVNLIGVHLVMMNLHLIQMSMQNDSLYLQMYHVYLENMIELCNSVATHGHIY